MNIAFIGGCSWGLLWREWKKSQTIFDYVRSIWLQVRLIILLLVVICRLKKTNIKKNKIISVSDSDKYTWNQERVLSIYCFLTNKYFWVNFFLKEVEKNLKKFWSTSLLFTIGVSLNFDVN